MADIKRSKLHSLQAFDYTRRSSLWQFPFAPLLTTSSLNTLDHADSSLLDLSGENPAWDWPPPARDSRCHLNHLTLAGQDDRLHTGPNNDGKCHTQRRLDLLR